MNRLPVLFRCDATPASREAFYQCLILAAAMQRRRRPTHFLSCLEPMTLAQGIRRGNNDWTPADAPVGSPEDLTRTLREIRKLEAAAVIVPASQVSNDYLAALRDTGTLVVALDAEASLRFPGRLVVNPFLAPDRLTYDVEPKTQVLAGEKYALIRPIIRRIRPLRSQEPTAPFRALVALGEDEQPGQTVERTRQLLATTRIDRIAVAARPHHPDYDKLLSLSEAHPNRIELIAETGEVGTCLPRCHFAVTGGDGWSLELACLGVPQLIVNQHDRHLAGSQRLEEEGCGRLLGTSTQVTAGLLRTAATELLGDAAERRDMSRNGRQLIDGRGPDRVINAMEVLLHPAQPARAQLRAA
jgi:spore coat polysaccharide biosynthesis predicted glycosyltransferase SpsG